MGRKFKYVYVPAALSEDIEELELEQPEGKEVECLLDALKAHFRAKHSSKTAKQLQAQKQELLKNLPPGTKIQDTMLDVATSLGLVENIALLNNAKALGYVGVNMYVDDEGAIKDAPRNPRATDFANCCGKALEVRGDAFISRIFDNEDDFQRLDFSMSEMSSSADWVKEARRRNEEAANSPHRDVAAELANKAAARSAGTSITELSPAECAKDSGNSAFKAGDYHKAVEMYSEALSHDAGMVAALNNRAMAQIKLGNFRLAEEDCNAVLANTPDNVKALLRRASAREGQSSVEGAMQDLEKVLELEPVNKQAQEQLERLRSR